MTTCSRFAVLVLASLALAAPAFAQIPVMLPEFQANTSPAGYNYADSVTLGADGRFIVTWTELGATNSEVAGRRFDPPDTPAGDQFPVNAVTTGNQQDSSVARDAEGRFVVVWADQNTSIWGRRFAADGTPLGGNFQVNTSTPTNATYPVVASDRSGNFVVAWTSTTASGSEGAARRFDSNGSPLGNEFPVNVFTPGFQTVSGVATSPSGFVVSWFGALATAAPGGTTYAIYARRWDEEGIPMTGDLQVNTATLMGDSSRPDVAMNRMGDFVVVWDDSYMNFFTTYGRRFFSDGLPMGAVFPVANPTASSFIPQVALDWSGNFLVTWETEDPEEFLIKGLYWDFGGFKVSSEFAVNQVTTGYQFHPDVSVAGNGRFIVTWTQGVESAFDVKLRASGIYASPQIVLDPPPPPPPDVSSPSGNLENGVWEPGETVVPRTAWTNDTAAGVALTGTSPLLTGPPGAIYTINDGGANYGTIAAGSSASCFDADDCYSITVSAPAVRPVQHWDALMQETLSIGVPKTWLLHIGESFPDVPTGNQFYAFVETLFHNRVTGGCAGGGYCPTNPVTRAQMAVFLLKSKFGADHIPPPCTGTVFNDVPCTGGPFDPWIEELSGLGITGGCQQAPPLYCPSNPVTRQQMAVFLLKAFEGSGYLPPACTGVFNDVTCPSTFANWIEELADRGITGGCGSGNYCPTNPNNRGQMAVFLVKTFGLVLYGG